MKIIYLTTSMEEFDYLAYTTSWSIPLNPSNQNFHNKIIRALAKFADVEVFSIRPFSRKYCNEYFLQADKKKVGNITWNYLQIPHFKLPKYAATKKQSIELLNHMDLKDAIVITDTINPVVSNVANKVRKKFKIPVIGICTDSPSNISGTPKAFSTAIFKMASNYDGYLALTSGLNNAFNVNARPSYIFEGIVEDNLPQPIENSFGKYIFFGGALMERYGIYNLIEAFKKVDDKDLRLLICGHHADIDKLNSAIESDSRIINLGIISNRKVLQLEMNSIANINPRPFSEDLDRFSIPSKTIEYLSTGNPTISVKNTKLKKTLGNNIIWSKTGDAPDLYDAMMKAINLSEEERKDFGTNARNKTLELYSQATIGKNIYDFLLQFIK